MGFLLITEGYEFQIGTKKKKKKIELGIESNQSLIGQNFCGFNVVLLGHWFITAGGFVLKNENKF